MGRQMYVYKNCLGEEAFFAGKINLLSDQYSKELIDLELEEDSFQMDGFKCNSIEILEKKIKERFLIINENECMIGSSIEEERKAIEDISLRGTEEKCSMDNLLFKMINKYIQPRFQKSLKSLSILLAEEINGMFEDGIQNYKVYSLKGLQNNKDYHAFDYVDSIINSYVLFINEYAILLVFGYGG